MPPTAWSRRSNCRLQLTAGTVGECGQEGSAAAEALSVMRTENIWRMTAVLVWTLLFACGDDEQPTPVIVDSLAGTTWRLKEIRDDRTGNVVFVPDSSEVYTLEFIHEGIVKAREACNTCEGTYSRYPEFNGITLTLTCTEIACTPPPLYGQYASDLNSVIEGGVLLDELRLLAEPSFEWLVHSRVVETR